MFDVPIGLGGDISPYGQNVDAMTENIVAVASNILPCSNPPYLLSDFLSFYPQFGGGQIQATGVVVAGSNVLTGVTGSGITPGMLSVGIGFIPDGATVVSVSGATVTISAQAMASGTAALTFYPLLVPLYVMQMYLGLANAVVNQARYKSMWIKAISDFIAHFLTLYLMSLTPAGASAMQVMVAGEARGLKVSKSAGDISASVDFNIVSKGIEGWAMYNATVFGQMFATIGKIAGLGGMFIR